MLVIANTLFQQPRRWLHMDITRWSILKSDYVLCSQRWRSFYYIISKSKSWSWLWLRSPVLYCKIQPQIDVSIAGGICFKPATNIWCHHPIKMHGSRNQVREVRVIPFSIIPNHHLESFLLINLLLLVLLNSYVSYFWILICKNSASESRHIQQETTLQSECTWWEKHKKEGQEGARSHSPGSNFRWNVTVPMKEPWTCITG